MANELAQDDGLIQEFVAESEEQLQHLEQDLLGLEGATDAELLNRVFRAMHTIKGTSSFLGFDPIVEVSHRAEDVLNAMRRGECSPTKQITDVLLESCDRLKSMLVCVAAKKEITGDNRELLARIDSIRSGQPKLGEILTQQPAVDSSELQLALAEAQRKGERIGEVLVRRGMATPSQVEQALGKQGIVTGVPEHTTMRVDVSKLDSLVNLVGELVLERNRLGQLSREFSSRQVSQEQFDAAFAISTTRLSFITEELQAASLSTRMVSIDSVFRRLPRMVRDVAAAVGKQVSLDIRGQDTEIDKTMVEQISDPLVHLVRNALDHGIEGAEVRVAAGKPPVGRLEIEAHPEGDQIVVSVRDDGRGIDPERIAAKAAEKGFISPERSRTLSRREMLELIFLPGMSTAEKVNNVSGRGVGMDVVRSNVKKLNGTVELDSVVGEGTTVRLRVPLTMAILPVLLVEVAGEIYALPLRSVQETLRVSRSQLHTIEGQEVLCLPDRTFPVVRLSEVFGISANHEVESIRAVIISAGETRIALLVERLIGQESTVIKSMGEFLQNATAIAGATISGDGRVRLVLDPSALVTAASSGKVN